MAEVPLDKLGAADVAVAIGVDHVDKKRDLLNRALVEA
jgi:hypothetical protein